MHKYYRFENPLNVKYLIKSLAFSIAMTTILLATLSLEYNTIGDDKDLGLGGRTGIAFNTRTTKSNINLHRTGIENLRIKGTFSNQSVVVSIVIESGRDDIEYINKMLLKEDSISEGILGGVNDNMGSAFNLKIKHEPRKVAVTPIAMSVNLTTALPLESIVNVRTKDLSPDGNDQTPKVNTTSTKAAIDTDPHITNAQVKGGFKDSPIAAGVVFESGNGTIEYFKKILLREGAIYQGRLGGLDPSNSGKCILKFGLEYKPIHGVLEIDETTGEFFYIPNDPNYSGPDSFGYFVSNDYFVNSYNDTPIFRQKSKYKQIFVSIQPITGKEALKRALKKPLWGYWHYLNYVKRWRS
jgi:hypothetical protein